MKSLALRSVITMKSRAYWVARARLGLGRFRLTFADLPHRRFPATVKSWVHPPVRFVLLQSLRALPARRLPAPSTFLGVPSPIATSSAGVHSRLGSVSLTAASQASQACFVPPSTFLTSSTASSSDDLCGFVSPHCHVRGSLFRGFPSRGAARARRSPLPSCRLRLPLLPQFYPWPKKPAPAFRAFLSA
jgi:hypothetical protein